MVPILKMRRFSCLLRLSLPPEIGEMAQTFISEIEWLAALKCRAIRIGSTSTFYISISISTLSTQHTTFITFVASKSIGLQANLNMQHKI